MRAYMVQSNKRIEPFGDHPRHCLVANRELGQIQRQVLQDLGLELKTTPDASKVEDPEEHIIFVDSLLFTKEVLQQFLSEARRLKRCAICAAKPGLFTLRSMVTTQDVQIHADRVEYGLRYVPALELRGEQVPVVLDLDQFSEPIPMPSHMHGGHEHRIPITDTVLIQIDHWANLWAANLGMLVAEVARLRKAPKVRLLGLALRARSWNKWKILRQVNKIGKNCDIHPTAYIEGSTIGDNVMIGAGSVIRLSLVGDGTAIGSNVTMEFSIAGEQCAIDSGSGAFGAVLYPGAVTSAGVIYFSLCGRDTFIAEGVSLSDFRFDQRCVTVTKDGNLVDTGSIGLGSCLGHGVYLGAGCVVAPGRAIPNGLRITPDEMRIIRKCDPDGSIPGHRRIDIDHVS